MDKTKLERLTKIFAIRVIRFVAKLPKNKAADKESTELLAIFTSIGKSTKYGNKAIDLECRK